MNTPMNVKRTQNTILHSFSQTLINYTFFYQCNFEQLHTIYTTIDGVCKSVNLVVCMIYTCFRVRLQSCTFLCDRNVNSVNVEYRDVYVKVKFEHDCVKYSRSCKQTDSSAGHYPSSSVSTI